MKEIASVQFAHTCMECMQAYHLRQYSIIALVIHVTCEEKQLFINCIIVPVTEHEYQ